MKVFLPPIGGLTVYCFGDPAKMSQLDVRLALRVHDECNGSDVFGSDIVGDTFCSGRSNSVRLTEISALVVHTSSSG